MHGHIIGYYLGEEESSRDIQSGLCKLISLGTYVHASFEKNSLSSGPEINSYCVLMAHMLENKRIYTYCTGQDSE